MFGRRTAAVLFLFGRTRKNSIGRSRVLCAATFCLIVTSLVATLVSSPRLSLEVAPGCDVPGTAIGRSFYVDPLRGSPSNDGSRRHPWRKLSDVLTYESGLVETGHYVPTKDGNALATRPVHLGAPIRGKLVDADSGPHRDQPKVMSC